MSTSPTRKELTHERIVETASRAIRRGGYHGVGVADIMKEAGLTHGGFYAHFPSRTALLVEAANYAGAVSAERMRKRIARAEPGKGLDAILNSYLGDRHVTDVEEGCHIAALVSETPRQEPEVRHAATDRIEKLLAMVARQIPDRDAAAQDDAAFGVVSAMVGALVLARAVDDPELSAKFRQAARDFIHAALD